MLLGIVIPPSNSRLLSKLVAVTVLALVPKELLLVARRNPCAIETLPPNPFDPDRIHRPAPFFVTEVNPVLSLMVTPMVLSAVLLPARVSVRAAVLPLKPMAPELLKTSAALELLEASIV